MREDDEQPDSPLQGQFVQEDPAETLEGDDLQSDPLDAGYSPPDRPSAETREQWSDEGNEQSLDERLAQEAPETPAPSDGDRAGRLVADADGRDVFGDDVGIDGGAASAEEAAVHERDGY